MNTLVVPAIITDSQKDLDQMLIKVIGKVKRVQLDIMDGEFVPNTSLNFDFKLPEGIEYEAHLMIMDPLEWIRDNAHKVDLITTHIETLKDIDFTIEYVRKQGVKINLAIIPKTPIESITPYLKKIDGLLVMTVDPGSYCINKEFNPGPLEKIRELRKVDQSIPIEVDGCMNPENVKLARESGANIFASGSYILKSENIDEALIELSNAAKI
ncbi:MAG: ribulose-phosphate 3-epimerase [Candidatus Bathyarchaeota archaeon]|nr:ribulose-phosphate 3-epimerase [Candidatus Bathyarchaeota archaeon]